jgi:hypothetical protein
MTVGLVLGAKLRKQAPRVGMMVVIIFGLLIAFEFSRLFYWRYAG